ncbi:MAG: 2-oxoisovalerate dehydrogenase [Planctomycetes bacterium]|nr:2-oxoisovalerate dehydrogenase [Planctomycetota bacterium]
MREIIFQIEEDPIDGGYVAQALGHGITTQGDTLEELRSMIIDAVQCHFDKPEDIPAIIRLHFVREEILTCPPHETTP